MIAALGVSRSGQHRPRVLLHQPGQYVITPDAPLRAS
jgi:hypothetical protein